MEHVRVHAHAVIIDPTITTDDSIEPLGDADSSSEDVAEAPQQPAQEPALPVHPLAASFPMLEGEELDELVDDIRCNGLHQPIVLDKTGQLIDGRNRLKACELAGVEPSFTTVDTEPIAYILGVNVNRRHLSKGQRAMAYAMAYPEATAKGGRGKTTVSNTGVSNEYITKARFVLRHAPDLAPKVMAGSSLTDAYNKVAEQKREQEAYAQLRADVREQVDAIVDVCTRLQAHTDNPTSFLDQGDFLRAVRDDVQQIITNATQVMNTV